MKVCHLRIGDGREEVHERASASIAEMLPPPDKVVVVNDEDHKLGFAGAIAEGWSQVRKTGCDWVVHLEMDFVFNSIVPVDRMIAVLERHPRIVQMALKRQPVNAEEVVAGGVIEQHPDDYEQMVEHGDMWVEHRRFLTTNPCVYPAALCAQSWPQESESEGKFTLKLCEDPQVRFGMWGWKYDPPACEHIGQRVGVGY